MWFSKKILFLILTTIIVLLGMEVFLQTLSFIFPEKNILQITPLIKDEKLGLRLNPLYVEHDRKGFHNKYVPDQADIVAMGDSQTYGVGVKIEEAWPQQLEKISKIRTYNMACGGYGPAHSLILFNEAKNLDPKIIIVAFYAGNDLYDSYSLIYNYKQLPQLKSSDPQVINAVIEIERINPFENIIWKFGIGKKENNYILKTREFLSKYCKIYGILRALKGKLLKLFYGPEEYAWKSIVDLMTIEKTKESRYIFNNGRIKTVFLPNYRFCAINFDNPRISEGFRISLEALHSISEMCKESNIHLIVLLIPTKELVFKDIVYQSHVTYPEIYKRLIENEELLWEKTKGFLKQDKIDTIEPLSALRNSILEGKQPYKISEDGHPNSIGHKVIADFVYLKIKENNILN